MFYTGFFGFLFFLVFTRIKHSRLRAALLCLLGAPVLFVGLARIYQGEHWASDVLGGYLLGGLALAAVIRFYGWGKGREDPFRLPIAFRKSKTS
jgi:undecaprenyl-diphosphatase